MANHRGVGEWGENEAAKYLARKGLSVADRHYQTRWGEIDLICREKDTWVFVEVKTRSHLYIPSAIDAITPAKQQKMAMAALSYMKWKRRIGEAMRFDVLLIEEGRIQWIPDAFEPTSDYSF